MDAEQISLISDIVVGVSAVFVAGVAFFGLQTWRKELTGKAKFEIARNTTLLSSRLKAEFQDAVNIFTSSAESIGRVKSESETPEESQVLNEWYARGHHLQPLSDDLRKFIELSWESEVVLGEVAGAQVSETLKIYRKSFAELSSAIYSYFETRRHEVVSNRPYENQDWLNNLHHIIYQLPDSDYLKNIESINEELASVLKRYVR